MIIVAYSVCFKHEIIRNHVIDHRLRWAWRIDNTYTRIRLLIFNKCKEVTEGSCGRAGGTQWEAVDGDVRSAGSGGDVSAPTTAPPSTLRQTCGSTVKPPQDRDLSMLLKRKNINVRKNHYVAGENTKKLEFFTR